MTSPSRSNTRRSTPCVAGCCGPMLRVSVSRRWAAMARLLPLRGNLGDDLAGDLGDAADELHRLLDQRIVLAQGMPLPVVRHEDAGQVGVAAEANAEEGVHLALQPVRRRPDRGGRPGPLAHGPAER